MDVFSRVVVRRPSAEEFGLLGQIEEEADSRYLATRFPELADTIGLPVDDAHRLAEQGRLLVADVDGTIAGFIAWCIESDPSVLGISQVSVLTPFGRAGIGTLLLEHVVELAARGGYRTVALNTQVDVPWNEPWYRRMGFVAVDPANWTDWMERCVADQQSDGLSWDQRVWMVLDLRDPSRPDLL